MNDSHVNVFHLLLHCIYTYAQCLCDFMFILLLYKILNGIICVNIDNCLTLSISNTRGNVCKFVKHYSRLDIRKYFFALTVFNI